MTSTAHSGAEPARAGRRPISSPENRGVRAPRLEVAAPAKLNLFLHVTGRRPDGYHLLESLIVPIDLCDSIVLTDRPDGVISRSSPTPGVSVDDDLAVGAARALQRATGCARGVDIAIEKRIPMGAGLGGGSSDAASVLLALNRLWALALPRAELARVGVTLGADVPFFVGGGPAIARGIGEALMPTSVPRYWFALAVPAVHVATAGIFAAPELTRDTPSAKISVFSEGYGRNDLQPVAVARFPEVAVALSVLARHSSAVRMTGSGGCVFSPFLLRADAEAAVASSRKALPGARVVMASTLAHHPLSAFA